MNEKVKDDFVEKLDLEKNEITPKEEQIEPHQFPVTTPEAKTMLTNLENARKNKDSELLSNLVFDADCENMGDQIDLHWYELYAARLIQMDQN